MRATIEAICTLPSANTPTLRNRSRLPGEGGNLPRVFAMKTCDQICQEQYACERRHKWNAIARSMCDKATGCRC